MSDILINDGNFDTTLEGEVVSSYDGVNAPRLHEAEGYNPDNTPRAPGLTDTITINGVEYGDILAEDTTPFAETSQHLGELVARNFLENPDKFGADWPSVTVVDPEWRAAHPDRTDELINDRKHHTPQPDNSRPDLGYMGQGRSHAADERQKQVDQAFRKAQHKRRKR